jgi:hypothetical protein
MNPEAERRKMFQAQRSQKTKLNECVLRWAVIDAERQLEGTIEEKITKTLKNLQQSATVPKVGGRKEWISSQTLENIAKRRRMEHTKENYLEYTILNKAIRQKIKEEYNDYKLKRLQETVLQRSSLKQCKRDIANARRMIATLK